jgi:hypothetical protein
MNTACATVEPAHDRPCSIGDAALLTFCRSFFTNLAAVKVDSVLMDVAVLLK